MAPRLSILLAVALAVTSSVHANVPSPEERDLDLEARAESVALDGVGLEAIEKQQGCRYDDWLERPLVIEKRQRRCRYDDWVERPPAIAKRQTREENPDEPNPEDNADGGHAPLAAREPQKTVPPIWGDPRHPPPSNKRHVVAVRRPALRDADV